MWLANAKIPNINCNDFDQLMVVYNKKRTMIDMLNQILFPFGSDMT